MYTHRYYVDKSEWKRVKNEELKLIKGNGTREVKLTIKHKRLSKQHRNQHDIETSTTKTRYKGTWGYQ